MAANRHMRLGPLVACAALALALHALWLPVVDAPAAPRPAARPPVVWLHAAAPTPRPAEATQGPMPSRPAPSRIKPPPATRRAPAQAPGISTAAAPVDATTRIDTAAEPGEPGGAVLPAAATEAAGPPLPTRVPPSAELVFDLQRGTASGEARLSWQADDARYALHLQARMPQGRELEQRSEGGFDAAGLAPLRLADRRRGRDHRAVNFQREHGKITFSGPRWELPLLPGTQDRLSWLVQLVAIAGAAPDGLRSGMQLPLRVVGPRGAASDWLFEVRGTQAAELAGGRTEVQWLVREPAHPYDHRIEVWLDPARGHWPLRLRQTQVPGGEPLQWTLRDEGPGR